MARASSPTRCSLTCAPPSPYPSAISRGRGYGRQPHSDQRRTGKAWSRGAENAPRRWFLHRESAWWRSGGFIGYLGGDWLRARRAENIAKLLAAAMERLRARGINEPKTAS